MVILDIMTLDTLFTIFVPKNEHEMLTQASMQFSDYHETA